MRLIFSSVAVLVLSGRANAVERREFSPLREVAVEGFDHPEFIEAMPAKEMLLDAKSRLWILGKSSLWMFELLNKQLVRIKIENLNHPLQTMDANSTNIFATNGRSIFAISLDDPSQIRRYDSPLQASQSNECMSADGGFVVWNHDKGRRVFNIIKQGFEDQPSSTQNNVCGVVSFEKYWQMDGNARLVFSDISDKKLASTETSFPVTRVARINDSVVAWGDKAVLRFSSFGQASDVVKVEGTKRIIQADFVDNIQSYLMNDGALEVFDSNQKTYRYYDTSGLVPPASVRLFRARKYVVALATAKGIRVFQMLDADK